jgi:hypothetical protein
VLTLAESYDGDGRSLKRVETKTQTTPFIVPDTTETVDYYLRSSVLGGRVITELNALGQKNKTKVYVGGEVEAEQVFNDGTPAVVWKYSNPVTGSSVEQTVYGLGKKEYDPFGLELGGSDPYLQHEEPDYASMGGSFYREGGNPFDSAGGYTLNGMPTDFGTISRLFQSGSAALCPNNNCGPRLSAQGWELWNSGRGWVPFGGTRKPPADPGIGKDGIVRVQTNEIGEGYWDSFRFFFAGPSSPQNPTATPTPDDCHRFADMVQDLANNAANTNRFLGEFARNFTAANDSSIREMERTQNMAPRNRFGDSGFKSDFQDGSNQVRHFAAGFIAGAQDPTSGIYALRRMNAREHPDINPLDQKDINLNRVSTQFGATYAGSGRGIEWIRSNLARAVRIAVCGDSP